MAVDRTSDDRHNPINDLWNGLRAEGGPTRSVPTPGVSATSSGVSEQRNLDARVVVFPVFADAPPTLPIFTSAFVGREGELAFLDALLHDPMTRLITLTGAGGIGKTRLALAIASFWGDRFAIGALFVDLSNVTRTADVIPALAQALGLRESSGQDQRRRLHDFLHQKHLLLVLDNFEQIIEAAFEVSELLDHAPHLTVLVTSRAPLRVSGEREVRVPPLGLAGANATPDMLLSSEAGRLFVARAKQHDPAFIVDERTAPLISEICARLDGLPLAIELAAARSRTLPPRQLLDRLQNRLPLLNRGRRDAPLRHQTMRDAIAWSYDLLTEQERRLFRWLAVFTGGCSIEAAEHMGRLAQDITGDVPDATFGGVSPSILKLLDALLDQSLLAREFLVEGEPRLRMLETIREYGREVTDEKESPSISAAHAHYFLQLARELRPLVTAEAAHVPLDRLAAEDANLRAALIWLDEHASAADTVAFVSAVCCYWLALSKLTEAQFWLERALRKRHLATPLDRARLMIGYAELLMLRGQEGDAEEAFAEGLTILRGVESPFDLAMAILVYGAFLNYQGRYEAAEACLGEALSLAESIDDDLLRATIAGGALANLCDSARGTGELEQAAAYGKEALRHYAGRHLDLAEARVLNDLAGIAKDQGDHQLVVERCLACLARMGARGDMRLVADALSGIATAATGWGLHRNALLLFAAADALRDKFGIALSLPGDISATRSSIDTLHAALGDADFATTSAAGRSMPLAAALAIAETVAPPSAGASPAQPPVTSPLTRRERDVLRLLAERRTDREIADTLFIGLRTVNWHVSSIIGKLGVTTRGEAVVRASTAGFI